jgi:hypothetical protein
MLLLGEGPRNIAPYSEFATLICTLESLKVSSCPVFPILYAVVFGVDLGRPLSPPRSLSAQFRPSATSASQSSTIGTTVITAKNGG